MNDVAKPMNAQQKFRETVADRIREDIGTLMPDEMLQEIVAQCIREELYDNVGTRYSPKAWITDHVKGVVATNVRELAKMTMDKHEQELRQHIKEQIVEQLPDIMAGIVMAMLKGQNQYMEHTFTNILNNIQRY